MCPLLFPLLFWTLGCSTALALTGPEMVRGQEQGSLMVQCRYDFTWKNYVKYWCQGAKWRTCKILLKTSTSGQEVSSDRISIKDNRKSFVFTVTMKNLRKTDAGVYWCGIEKSLADIGFEVYVIVDPAPTTVSTTIITTTSSTASTIVEETSILPTLISHYSNNRHGVLELRVLLPIIISSVLLLLLAMALFLAWRMMRRHKKAAELPPEQALQPLEGDLCYVNLTLQQPRTFPGSSEKRISTRTSGQADQAEVDYVTMAPFPREDISYASLNLNNLDQEPTYSNAGHLATRIPSLSQEESTEYSSIRRP